MPTTWIDTVLRRARTKVGTFPYPHQAAVFLDNPIRRAYAKPSDVIDAIGLTGDEHVLELGPGPGFYSTELARRLTTGRLELFDVQPEMLEKARRKLERAGYVDVGFHAGEAGAPFPFADATFDVAFLAEVIGEVPDQPACLNSLARVIKPGGVLVFEESFPDPDRLTVAELRALAEPAGFSFIEARGGRWRDVVRFVRRAD
jgi:ubiquinone/menaquinone biosynthesis C-methylase UbiE